jgi:hypothetical protein
MHVARYGNGEPISIDVVRLMSAGQEPTTRREILDLPTIRQSKMVRGRGDDD